MIDEYILGELSDADKKAFELHFFECDSCFQELKLRQKIVHLIKKEGDRLVPEYLEKESKTDLNKDKASVSCPGYKNRWFPAYAAAAILIILISSYFPLRNVFQKDVLSAINFDHNVPYEYISEPTFRGSEKKETSESLASFKNNFSTSMLEYMDLNYNLTISQLKSIESDAEQIQTTHDQKNSYVLLRDYYFYLGVSCLAAAISKKIVLDKPQRDSFLQQASYYLSNSKDVALKHHLNGIDKDHYFLALAFGFTGHFNFAVAELQKLKQDSDFYPKTDKLLKELNKN